jgi:hypothetical protein
MRSTRHASLAFARKGGRKRGFDTDLSLAAELVEGIQRSIMRARLHLSPAVQELVSVEVERLK